tara:strand:- start:1078 stop:2082 length:1005 start_codon:yes stop_codon:yes gene_type:complete
MQNNNNLKNKKIFILGGAGYVGAELVKSLLEAGYSVTVFDLFIYGEDVIQNHPNLTTIKGDMRDLSLLNESIKGCTDVIHLACISNDPSFELDSNLGKSINYDCFEPFIEICLKNKIQSFIYASSSSVYGIKKEKNVTEEMKLEPLTDYSYYKAKCENILQNYSNDNFITTILRPATVCGYSKRQRLDVIVNILTNHAYNNKKIKIFGGSQLRPNIHIKDMVRCYISILNTPNSIKSGKIFNAGYQNQSLNEIAQTVKNCFIEKIEIETVTTDDNRSYHISSEKIKREIGFNTIYGIEDAAKDLINAFENKLLINPLNNSKYYNIKKMQEINLS